MSQHTSTRVITYLFFYGRCEEAMNFYRDKLGATINFSMRFNESPQAMPDGVLQPGFEDKIMHAEMQIGETAIFTSDGCDDKGSAAGCSLALRTLKTKRVATSMPWQLAVISPCPSLPLSFLPCMAW